MSRFSKLDAKSVGLGVALGVLVPLAVGGLMRQLSKPSSRDTSSGANTSKSTNTTTTTSSNVSTSAAPETTTIATSTSTLPTSRGKGLSLAPLDVPVVTPTSAIGGDLRVAAVTGGAQGIGYGVALRLGRSGYKVVLMDVQAEKLEEARRELANAGVDALTVPLDVNSEEEVSKAFEAVAKTAGRLDVLVQAAGVVGKTKIKTHEVDPANFDFVLGVNLRGIFLCARAAVPIMLEQATPARIINIASIAGKEGNAGMLAYSTSKAGVIGLTKVMGKEYAETKLTVNAIAPAVIRTAMVEAMPHEQVKYMTDKIPMKRTGTIEEVAAMVEYIASPEASFTTGFTFDMTGGRATY